MYLNLRVLARAEYLAFFSAPFSAKRWAYTVLLTAALLTMWLLIAIGRGLDHLLFPGFRRQPVRAPVFIIAPPRSGTTLTQKLMALDSTRFVHTKLFQTIFPSICWQRLLHGIVRLDQLTGRGLAKGTSWLEKCWFGGWDELHRIRLDQPEEEGGFFVYTFLNASIYLLFLHIEELWEAGFPDTLPPKSRERLMQYYRGCLQRQAYLNGPDKTLLCKATQNSGAVESLLQAFPDAKFITLFRDPHEAIASHVSIFYPVWKSHSPHLQPDSQVSRAYALLAVRWYQHLHAFRKKVAPAQFHCIDYRDLTRDPKAALEKLYRHFGWDISEAFRARLDEATQNQRAYRSRHAYSLEEFGLSPAWIEQQLGEILKFHALPRRPSKSTCPRSPCDPGHGDSSGFDPGAPSPGAIR